MVSSRLLCFLLVWAEGRDTVLPTNTFTLWRLDEKSGIISLLVSIFIRDVLFELFPSGSKPTLSVQGCVRIKLCWEVFRAKRRLLCAKGTTRHTGSLVGERENQAAANCCLLCSLLPFCKLGDTSDISGISVSVSELGRRVSASFNWSGKPFICTGFSATMGELRTLVPLLSDCQSDEL